MNQLPTIQIPVGSVDLITATVQDLEGNDLAMGVEIAVTREDDGSTTHQWLPAEWLGAVASERQARTVAPLDTSGLVHGSGVRHGVYVRLDNTPAHPIIHVGWIVLTD